MKRAQAAMEFLMTYGWALLVVLVAIGALAFFGVLSPGQFLPDQCVLFPGFTCSNYYAWEDTPTGTFTFDVQNGLGYPMYNTRIVVIVDGTPLVPSFPNCNLVGGIDLSEDDLQNCKYQIFSSSGDTIRGTISVAWEDAEIDGNSRSRVGNFVLVVS